MQTDGKSAEQLIEETRKLLASAQQDIDVMLRY